jgi:hypothetical protein
MVTMVRRPVADDALLLALAGCMAIDVRGHRAEDARAITGLGWWSRRTGGGAAAALHGQCG